MAYQRQNFANEQRLFAENLNHIEDGIEQAVSYTEQALTEEQKAQVRENIGATSETDVNALIDTKLGVIENGSY